eukprot:COSAG05_NODE_594_length_8461_cov_4.373475_6_plen_121_part_00
MMRVARLRGPRARMMLAEYRYMWDPTRTGGTVLPATGIVHVGSYSSVLLQYIYACIVCCVRRRTTFFIMLPILTAGLLNAYAHIIGTSVCGYASASASVRAYVVLKNSPATHQDSPVTHR